MSRIILTKDEAGEPRLVVGWDRPMSTYFCQVMDDGIAEFWVGDHHNALPTLRSLLDAMHPSDREHVTEQVQALLRAFGEGRQEDDGSSNTVLDYVDPPSWRVQVRAVGEDTWSDNAIFLPTKAEAEGYAQNLYQRWTLAEAVRVVPDFNEPTYTFENNTLMSRT